MTVYSPPDTDVVVKGPLVFLAGPIQGAPDWQSEAIKILQKLNPEFNIANPRREYLDGDFDYNAQVDWETHFLTIAGRAYPEGMSNDPSDNKHSGTVLFWFAKELEHNCDRAYAQTSRLEFGEWKVMHAWFGSEVVVGIEEGFTGERYIRRRIGQDCPEIPICKTLEDTCRKAVEP